MRQRSLELITHRLVDDVDWIVVHCDQDNVGPGRLLQDGETESERGLLNSIVCSGLRFSLFVFVDSRRRDRRDVFLKINEYLTSEDILRGRYVLHQKVADEASVENLSDREYRDVHRAITAFNTLGLYVRNGYLDEQDVLDIWATSVYRAWLTAQPYIAHRERTHAYHPWAYFEPLAKNCQESIVRKGKEIKVVLWRRQPPGDSE